MTVCDKIKDIRLQLKLSQADLAKRMFIHKSLISKFENGQRAITADVLDKFRQALGLQGVPITPEEVLLFEEELYNWKSLMLYGDIEAAKACKHKLEPGAKWCTEPHLKDLYDIFSVIFYRMQGDTQSCKKVLASLSERAEGFTGEYLYWYYRLVAVDELTNRQYKKAFATFLKAEKLDKHLSLSDEGTYYNMGYCLTEMGYSFLAIEYTNKAIQKAAEKANNSYGVYEQLQLASNYGRIGWTGKAIALLNSCLRDEKAKKDAKETIGLIYSSIAMVYHESGDSGKAIEFLNTAEGYYSKGTDECAYNQYCKARVLLECSKVREGLKIINNALNAKIINTTRHELFITLKHSVSLHNDESRKYIEETAIPSLLERGNYLPVVRYCNNLSTYYEGTQRYQDALQYSNIALNITQKLLKGDLIL